MLTLLIDARMLICWSAAGPKFSEYLRPYIQQVMVHAHALSIDVQIEYFHLAEEAERDALIIRSAYSKLLERQGESANIPPQLNTLSIHDLTSDRLLRCFPQETYGQLAVVTPIDAIQAKLRNSPVTVFPVRSSLTYEPLANIDAGKWCLVAYDSIAVVKPGRTTQVSSAFLKFYQQYGDSIQVVALYSDLPAVSDRAKLGAFKAHGITLNHACTRMGKNSDAKRLWLSKAVTELLNQYPDLAGCIVIGPDDHNIKSIGCPVLFAKPVHWVNAHLPNQFLPEAAPVLTTLMQRFKSPDRPSPEPSLFVMN
jgi:hypothetical protein